MSATRRLTTPEEIDALPVGTKVWAPTGREYTVEIWDGHPGHEDNTTTRVLTAPGRVSGVSSFIALHGWASLDPVSAAEASGLVDSAGALSAIVSMLSEHPGYHCRVDDEGWRAVCTGKDCRWSSAVLPAAGAPGGPGASERAHRQHVAECLISAGVDVPPAVVMDRREYNPVPGPDDLGNTITKGIVCRRCGVFLTSWRPLSVENSDALHRVHMERHCMATHRERGSK